MGGGTSCSPPEFIYFSADYYEIWYRSKTSHDLKDSTINISQDYNVMAHFHKMWQQIRKYDRKIWHTLMYKSLVFEAVILILHVFMTSICDILYC